MGMMLAPTLALLIRHGLTAVGMIGVVSGSQIEMMAGGVAAAVGIGWSWWNAKKNNA